MILVPRLLKRRCTRETGFDMEKRKNYPFTAILGQEPMKEALLLNLIDPSIGGVLIRGQKGTAKTTAVRALADLLPGLKVVELPANATVDRVAGNINVGRLLQTGEQSFEPGILKEADKQILYVDEVNLLEDHIVDLILDAAATGVNHVEREGISFSHASRFVLIGTMNPEEGRLRPQLLDRFGLVVDVESETDPGLRVEIIRNRLAFEENPASFCRKQAKQRTALTQQIKAARALLPTVETEDALLYKTAEISLAYGVQGHRADITMIKAAKAMAALQGQGKVSFAHLKRAAFYVLPHRMRKSPLDTGAFYSSLLDTLFKETEQLQLAPEQQTSLPPSETSMADRINKENRSKRETIERPTKNTTAGAGKDASVRTGKAAAGRTKGKSSAGTGRPTSESAAANDDVSG